MSARRLDATTLRDWAHTAVAGLIVHTDEINRLNVFPVADADTGTNMLFTMRAACARADSRRDDDVVAVAAALAEGALQGARGNSGVILSQILRGLADVTAEAADERDGDLADVDGDGVRRRPATRGRPGRRVGRRDRARHHRLGAAGGGRGRRGRRRRWRGPRLGRRVGGRSGGGRPGEDPTTTRRARQGGRGRRGRAGAAGPARRDDHRAGRARRRSGPSTRRPRRRAMR